MGVRHLLRCLVVAAVLITTGCGTTDPLPPLDTSSSPTVGPVSSDGRGLAFTDWGFTVLSTEDDVIRVNYGAVLRNESRRDAIVNTLTDVRWLDETGAQITATDGRVAGEDLGIAWLPPGATMAVSGTVDLAAMPSEPTVSDAAFDWVPLTQVSGWGDLEVENVAVTTGDPSSIDFRLTSTFGDTIDVEAPSVLINEEGSIIGGTSWREGLLGKVSSGSTLVTIDVDEVLPDEAVSARVYPHVAYGTWNPIARG